MKLRKFLIPDKKRTVEIRQWNRETKVNTDAKISHEMSTIVRYFLIM